MKTPNEVETMHKALVDGESAIVRVHNRCSVTPTSFAAWNDKAELVTIVLQEPSNAERPDYEVVMGADRTFTNPIRFWMAKWNPLFPGGTHQ